MWNHTHKHVLISRFFTRTMIIIKYRSILRKVFDQAVNDRTMFYHM